MAICMSRKELEDLPSKKLIKYKPTPMKHESN